MSVLGANRLFINFFYNKCSAVYGGRRAWSGRGAGMAARPGTRLGPRGAAMPSLSCMFGRCIAAGVRLGETTLPGASVSRLAF